MKVLVRALYTDVYEQRMAGRFRRAVNAGRTRAAQEGVELVVGSMKTRLRLARRRNAQDFPKGGPISQRPISSKVNADRGEGLVVLRSFVSEARTPAAEKVFPAEVRIRKGIWVLLGPLKRSARGRFAGRQRVRHRSMNRNGLKFFAFSKHPRLREWAKKADQVRRHAVRFGPGIGTHARLRLVMRPALAENREKIARAFGVSMGSEFRKGGA